MNSIFLSASPSFHASLSRRAIAKSEYTKYTAAETRLTIAHSPGDPWVFNLLSSSCSKKLTGWIH
ncbi:hypothetical protein QUA95_15885 [Microcoleus sp. F10_A2]|uniref:hypothetical protein n=1 Tax=unclassified Microcoleus TaxID=2642155 RepID=UPI002FD47D28